jgi:hypothetical protein
MYLYNKQRHCATVYTNSFYTFYSCSSLNADNNATLVRGQREDWELYPPRLGGEKINFRRLTTGCLPLYFDTHFRFEHIHPSS